MSQSVTQHTLLRSRSLGTLVPTLFGTLWAFGALAALNLAAGWFPLVAVGLIALLLFAESLRLIRLVRRRLPAAASSQGRKMRRNYLLVNVLQGAAVIGTILVLSLTHHQEWILPSIAFIVGLHFFALVSVLRRRLYYVVGTAMCLLVLLTVLLLPFTATLWGTQVFPWGVVIGAGCALILWSTAAETLLQIRASLRLEELPQSVQI